MRLVDASPLVELASGVDSFYFSGRAALPALLVADLDEARALARELQQPTLFDVGPVAFRVAASGMGRYPYRLEHVRGVVALSTSSRIPTVRVQPRAAFIHAVGLWEAVQWFVDTIEILLGSVDWKVARVDLFMDAHGWQLTAADRQRFVARSKQVVVYEDDAAFRTLQFGTSSSGIKARIYDKTEESAKKGSDWWPSVWGGAYEPGQRAFGSSLKPAAKCLSRSGSIRSKMLATGCRSSGPT